MKAQDHIPGSGVAPDLTDEEIADIQMASNGYAQTASHEYLWLFAKEEMDWVDSHSLCSCHSGKLFRDCCKEPFASHEEVMAWRKMMGYRLE